MQLGDAKVMMFDARPDWPPTPAYLRLYVDDARAVHRQAVEAGGTSVTEEQLAERYADPDFTKAMDYVQGSEFFPAR